MRLAFVVLLLAALAAGGVGAAVTFSNFQLAPGTESIVISWETASEAGNLGFYVWRSEAAETGFAKLPLDRPNEQFIPATSSMGGGYNAYEFTDVQVTPGVVYYYRAQDIPADGTAGQYTEVLSATLAGAAPPTSRPPAPTRTPSPTPSATPTAAPSATPTATVTPPPSATAAPRDNVRFWAAETELVAGECTTVQWQATGVQSLRFNNVGVTGQGAQTFCPCASQEHTLTAVYADGSSETFIVELTVSGTCDDPRATPTATSPAPAAALPTATPRPLPSPNADLPPGPTRVPPPAPPDAVSPLATPLPEDAALPASQEGLPALPRSPLPTPPPAAAPGLAAADTVVVEGETLAARPGTTLTRWFILATCVGLGCIAAGVWIWRRG